MMDGVSNMDYPVWKKKMDPEVYIFYSTARWDYQKFTDRSSVDRTGHQTTDRPIHFQTFPHVWYVFQWQFCYSFLARNWSKRRPDVDDEDGRWMSDRPTRKIWLLGRCFKRSNSRTDFMVHSNSTKLWRYYSRRYCQAGFPIQGLWLAERWRRSLIDSAT